MSNFNADEMMKSLNVMRKQASNLINSTLTPDLMSKLTAEQLAQVKSVQKDMRELNRKGLTKDSNVFKQFDI